jgi:hypothetical protein
MKHRIAMVLILAGVACAQSKPVPSVPCTTKACQSFNELARGHDSAVVQADMACFYDGDNPANAESEGNRTTDEFFLTMDGKKAVTRRGEHPGIFVSVVLNGQPEDYGGYGPKHGGLEDADIIKAGSLFDDGNAGLAHTYDDLGDAIRFARFWFGKSTIFNGQKLVTSEEVLVQNYHEVVIRKSTKRFTEKMIDFRPWPANPSGPETKENHGLCYAMKK